MTNLFGMNSIKSKGKVALVTGSSKGIGAEIAKKLAKDGFTLVVNHSRQSDLADEIIKEIEFEGGNAISYRADVSDPSAIRQMFHDIQHELGSIDVLINNAGVMELAPIADISDESVARQIDINLKGVIYTLREAATHLAHGGRIVNLSSSVTELNMENYGIYAATKASVETLTRVLSKELRGKEITVNAVSPGPTATDLFLKDKSKDVIDKLANMSPLGRLGTAQDIASVVSFIVGNDGTWINGQVIRANGGLV
ncbi:SDR family oxidoreductase [Vibrio fortis]|uniref:SDR family oxidoreductase n=1 Tax=Vibrio fortis TaxID=212667 RepID=UPI0038CDBEDC